MSTFLKRTDYDSWVGVSIMQQLIGTNNARLDDPELMAQGMITDACGDKYDMVTEFARTSTSRNNTLKRWMLSLATYFLYHDIADIDTPDRVVKDYDDTRAELRDIASGKRDVNFSRLTDDDGYSLTSFTYGSDTVRTHDPY